MTTVANLYVCAIDQSTHESLDALHKHLRKLKVKLETYYTDHAPVRDRHTGEVIAFKAPAAEHIRREFASRVTLKQWLAAHPDEGRDWALDWLVARKIEKGLVYAPTQVELRSVPAPCPDVRYYDRAFEGGYAGTVAWAGYQPRFTGGELNAAALPGPVVIDTREQKPLALPCPSVRGTLRSADYGLTAEHDHQVYVERKSLQDLVGTLSERETRAGDSNLQRFTRELERATEIGAYVVLLVEQKLSDCLAYHTIPYLRRQFANVRITPEHVFHNLRDLLQQFPFTMQALFVDGRVEAANAVVRVLAASESVKSVDLQLEYDMGRLTLTS